MFYRRKPAVVEAWQWDGVNPSLYTGLPSFIEDALHTKEIIYIYPNERVDKPQLRVKTFEGFAFANPRDFIMRELNKGLYPYKPDIFEAAYEKVDQSNLGVVMEKTLDVTNMQECREKISDVKVFGSPGRWVCLCKASSESQGWMKSTKTMPAANGVVLQVSTQQRNPDGSYALAEAICFIPNSRINDDFIEDVL